MKHVNVSLFVPHLGCPHNCVFCNQKTISGAARQLTAAEITGACQRAAADPHDVGDSEIAFFGGSFTAIDRSQMISFLEAAKPFVGTSFGGIRISTRPDAIDEEVLGILKSYGVKSIELGAQSTDRDVLMLNERGHSPEDTFRASRLIKSAGFSLGLQMMTGLYGSSEEKDLQTARDFTAIHPDTVRIYPTVVLEGTKLASLYREGLYAPPGFNETVRLCSELLEEFYINGIKVIRLGLHSGGNVEEGFVAGVYHPAFGEICESLIYRRKISAALAGFPPGEYEIGVAPGEISKAVGHKRSNLEFFAAAGYKLKIRERAGKGKYEAAVE